MPERARIGLSHTPGARPAARCNIGTLRLAIPGGSASVGHNVAQRVAQHLATQIPPGLHGNFVRLELRVEPKDFSEAGLSQAVADAITRALTRLRERE